MRQPGFIDYWAKMSSVFDHLLPPESVEACFPDRLLELSGQTAPRVLDLGCGGGRHTLPLLRAGIAVESWDIDESGLRSLAERAGRQGLEPRIRHIDFLQADLSDFRESFDIVLCLGSGLIMMTREAQRAWMQRTAELLADGGSAFVELHHRPFVESLHRAGPKRRFEVGIHEGEPVTASAHWEPDSDFWSVEYRFRSDGTDVVAHELANIPSTQTLIGLAQAAGLTHTSTLFTWHGSVSASDARLVTNVFRKDGPSFEQEHS